MQHGKKSPLIVLMIGAFLVSTLQSTAHAAVISTDQYLAAIDRTAAIERVDAVLAREEVRRQLEWHGVEPAEASARLAALTDQELQLLADNLEELPAGGNLLGVVGVVFVVLLILELVGVIDIFNRI
jgi:hypothetical protein